MEQRVAPVIRRATQTDAHMLAELGARTFQETFAADNKPADMEAYLTAAFSAERQAAELADPRAVFLLAELAGRVGGYAAIRAGDAPECVTDARPIELVRLYVAREWIGRGVGAALMRACIAEAQALGYRTMWLGVWEHNYRAQDFYRKWGFERVGAHIFQLGSDAQTDLLLERTLL